MKRSLRTLALASVSLVAMVVTMTTTSVAAGATEVTGTRVGAAATQAGGDAPASVATANADQIPASAYDPSGSETMGGGQGTKQGGYAATYAAAPVTIANSSGGNMFDTCDAPPLTTMRAWLASPYRSVGIYIGGSVRGCKAQPNLTPSWITSTAAMGWSHVPIYVGLQAPCTAYSAASKMSTNEATAAAQGRAAALDGMVQMRKYGIDRSVPLYLDVENYSVSNGPCSVSVHAFTNAWTATLHAGGYLSGIYGSASSMIHHIQAWTTAGSYTPPDNVWFARWNGVANADEPELLPSAWIGRRIHQFAGGHKETWGGVTLNIDSNFIQSFTTAPSYMQTVTPRIAWDSKAKRVGTRPVALAMAGKFGIPATASAVVLNVQIANPTGPGNLIVEPYKSTTQLATQQFQKGQYVSTTVVVPVSQKVIQFRTTASAARLIVGVVGYLTTTGTDGIAPVQPRIVWDSKTPTVGRAPAAFAVRGVGAIPADASAVVLNVQVAGATSSGQLIVEPHGVHSTIGVQQYTKGRAISAVVIVPLKDSAIQVRLSAGRARVIVSTLGYLAPSAPGMVTATNPTLVWDSVGPKVTPTGASFAVAGRNGVPTNATAALLNVEVVNPAARGQLIVEPYGFRSNTGVQQFIAGQSISTTVLVPLNKGVAHVRVSAGKARVIVTSVGYVTPASAIPSA